MFENNAQAPLNPHFLFNSMNAIRYMIFENQDQASELLSNLAELIRYQLADGKTKTNIENELVQVEHLLSLEQLRLEERLDVTLDINLPAKPYRLKQTLILPLLEYVFIEKDIYGVLHNQLTIKCAESNDQCIITISLTQSPKIKPGKLEFTELLTKLNASDVCEINQTLTENCYNMELIINNDY